MELILDDDDHMQFYPALDDVEAAVLHVVSAVSGTMQNVPTVQVPCSATDDANRMYCSVAPDMIGV